LGQRQWQRSGLGTHPGQRCEQAHPFTERRRGEFLALVHRLAGGWAAGKGGRGKDGGMTELAMLSSVWMVEHTGHRAWGSRSGVWRRDDCGGARHRRRRCAPSGGAGRRPLLLLWWATTSTAGSRPRTSRGGHGAVVSLCSWVGVGWSVR
jgi:hypothetical protein